MCSRVYRKAWTAENNVVSGQRFLGAGKLKVLCYTTSWDISLSNIYKSPRMYKEGEILHNPVQPLTQPFYLQQVYSGSPNSHKDSQFVPLSHQIKYITVICSRRLNLSCITLRRRLIQQPRAQNNAHSANTLVVSWRQPVFNNWLLLYWQICFRICLHDVLYRHCFSTLP
jgi:hypothetical protein